MISTLLIFTALLAAIYIATFGQELKAERPVWSDLWRWDGTVNRPRYLAWGLLLFALKHNLDRFVAWKVFGRSWTPFNYFFPPAGAALPSLGGGDARFYGTLLVLALPFVWSGVVLTIRRLRSAGLPPWLIGLFFIPFVNLLFFIALAAVPDAAEPGAERPESGLERWLPDTALGAAAAATALTAGAGAAFAALGALMFRQYGWGLFVGVPFCQGLMAAVLFGAKRPRGLGESLLVATLAMFLTGAAIFACAVEGVFCLVMALPFALVLSLLGGWIGWLLQRRPAAPPGAAVAALLISLPFLMGAERAAAPEPELREAVTEIEIGAPPELVWKHVVSFAEIPAPKEWLFRAGIAYPVRAVIEGRGPGAVRRCVFSTGEFVEPIEKWDEPRELGFSVRAQPESMQETSPYPGIKPAHLSGYLQSKRGRFLLEPLPGGRTRLVGTTWYVNRMWPEAYWTLWSDSIIHRIHLRVLRHIRDEAESASRR